MYPRLMISAGPLDLLTREWIVRVWDLGVEVMDEDLSKKFGQ